MAKAVSVDDLPRRLRVKPGTHPKLAEADASRTFGWDEAKAELTLHQNRRRLEHLQYKLYADGRFALLVVLQAIDGGGKDSTIRHVMTAFNPEGCTVTSFKVPSTEERKHDFLWRVHQRVPQLGHIGIFNRSHYEEVLVPRVLKLVPRAVWRRRYEQINDFERMLRENDVRIVKLFLHISRDEQKKRLEERIREPHKQWKFDPSDLETRKHWDDYHEAFKDMLARCSTQHASWYAIPADHKWFRNVAVSQILLQALESLPLRFPKPNYDPSKIRVP